MCNTQKKSLLFSSQSLVVSIFTTSFNTDVFRVKITRVYLAQTAIIFVYVVNIVVFITCTGCVYSAVRAECWNIIQVNASLKAVQWLMQLIFGLSPRRPGLDRRSMHVRFVVDRVALGQVFLPVIRFSLVSIIPSVLHTFFHLHVALTRRTNGRSVVTSRKALLSGKSDSTG